MSDIGDWELGTFSPQWISSVDWDGYPSVILNCAAEASDLIPARWEINQVFNMACRPENVIRKPLMNGGECFKTSPNCSAVTITDGMYQWSGVVLYPKFKEDSFSGEVIEWQIPLELNENSRLLLLEDPTEEVEP